MLGPTSELAERLGARHAIFGFSHDWEVVAAVSTAGGCGVLGTNRYRPESLAADLARLVDRVGDAPFGVNLLVPAPSPLGAGGGQLEGAPAEHVAFVRDVCAELGLRLDGDGPAPDEHVFGGGSMTTDHAMALWEVCRAVDPALVSVGLGTPPRSLMEEAAAGGAVRVALAGSRRHAERLVAEGFDCLVAQGAEAAGHIGTVGTFVLVPEIVEVAGPRPVLAAGGVSTGAQIAAAEVLGAAGAWIGSALLPTAESRLPEPLKERILASGSGATVRTRALTGKPSRQLRNALLDAWDRPGAPVPLPSPLQGRLMEPAVVRGLASSDPRLMITPAGQGIGLLDRHGTVAELMDRLVAEYRVAVERHCARVAGSMADG
jgi:NAD(P)H-dependent flavin oxidoreductase YrpB (nitropropane dioxygenase family)